MSGHRRARQRAPRALHTRIHSTSTPTSGYEHRKSRTLTFHVPSFALHMRSTPHDEHVVSEHHAAWARATRVLICRRNVPPIAGSTASERHLSLSLLWQAVQPLVPAPRATPHAQHVHVHVWRCGRTDPTDGALRARRKTPFANAFESRGDSKCSTMH